MIKAVYCIFFSDCLDEFKYDPEAFIFTLKNPHGVEPTQFMKRKECEYSLECTSNYGPDFCNNGYSDLIICNIDGTVECFIANNGTNGYKCHPEYKVALYASNSHYSEEPNLYIPVLDYQVYHCY